MMLFWLLAALLVVATVAVLLLPLLRGAPVKEAPDASSAAASVYRDQKRVLDAEYADGAITAEERDAGLADLARRLSEEVGGDARRSAPALGRRSVWLVAAVLLIVIPSTAVFMYFRLGEPAAVVAAPNEREAHDMSPAQVDSLVASLAQRLKSRPDDVEGWVLLAHSYQALGRYAEASDAYAHATALVPNDPSLLADYADVLAMSLGRRVEGKPAALARQALAIDPNHPKALALAATAAMQSRDLDGALALWRRLAAQYAEGSDDAKQVAAIIAEVEGMKGTAAPTAARSATIPAAAPAEVAIVGHVDIAPALASKVALSDTVFIFARAAEGPRMPLAILRMPAKQLPADFRLDDSMGMMGAKLSQAASVIVEARVSKNGTAGAQPGDLSGSSAPVKPGTSGVNVTIDQVVK